MGTARSERGGASVCERVGAGRPQLGVSGGLFPTVKTPVREYKCSLVLPRKQNPCLHKATPVGTPLEGVDCKCA